MQLLEGLWEEYGETRPAEQRARLRLALQLGGLSFALGRYEEARRWLGEAERLARALGDQARVAGTLHQLGMLAQSRGDLEGAMRLYRESLAIQESLGAPQGKAATLAMMGQVLLAQGRLLEGVQALREAQEILVGMGARADAEWVEETLAQARQMLETEQGTNARITNQEPRITPAR